jgi:hypothetical protein
MHTALTNKGIFFAEGQKISVDPSAKNFLSGNLSITGTGLRI